MQQKCFRLFCSFPMLAPEVSIRLKRNICFYWSTNSVIKYYLDTDCVPWRERVTIGISFQQVELGNVSS